MKTFIVFLLSLFLSMPVISLAQEQQRDANNFKVFSGQTIFGSGNSVVVVDLRDPRYDKIVEFDFSIQLSGITSTEGEYLAGATIDAIQFVTLPVLPSGNVAEGFSGILSGNSIFTAKINWTTVVNDLNIQSGDTEFGVPLFAEKGRFLLLRLIAGAADILTSLWIDMD